MNKLIEKLDKILADKWDDINERWEEIEKNGDNPYDEWNEFLTSYGMIASYSYEWNWNKEWGIISFIGDLINTVNKAEKPLLITDSPEETNMGHTLVFDRQTVMEKLK